MEAGNIEKIYFIDWICAKATTVSFPSSFMTRLLVVVYEFDTLGLLELKSFLIRRWKSLDSIISEWMKNWMNRVKNSRISSFHSFKVSKNERWRVKWNSQHTTMEIPVRSMREASYRTLAMVYMKCSCTLRRKSCGEAKEETRPYYHLNFLSLWAL